MTVRFILGPAGAGKTHCCVSELAAAISRDPLGPPLLFIVPEQATFIHERLLAQACPGGGFCRAEVTGFSRLAYRACRFARRQPLPALSNAGKLLLMRAAVKRHENELRVFAATARRAGFAAQLAAAAEELQVYGVEPAALREAALAWAAEEPNSHFAGKLREIALLYDDYAARLAGNFGSYAENMSFLAEQIRAGLLADTEVYIDGYSAFTPAERQVVQALMSACPRVHICLLLDPARAGRALSEADVFYPTWHTYATLREAAEQAGVRVEPPLLLKRGAGRFKHNPELDALERDWAGGAVAPITASPRMIAEQPALDRRAEVQAVGREIRRLTREEGLRYREISILARESGPYAHLLEETLGEMDIPYFIDSKKPLLYHPLIELVRAALEAWSSRPHYRQMMRLLKNGLSPLAGEEADLLDNYCLAHGVRFYHWRRETWSFPLLEGEDEVLRDRIDAVRGRGALPVLTMLEALGEQTTAARLHAALLAMFASWGVPQRLREWQEAALHEGRGEDASCHAQVWSKLADFFAEAELLLGDNAFSAAELAELYDSALLGLSFSTIPPGLDQVLVASLERSRNPEIKAAFVLGVNEGELPRRIVMDGLFRDEERRLLAERGIALAPDTRTRQFEENYLCYVALTRSGGRLYLSYPLNDEEGAALAPSPLLRRVHALFPALTPRIAGVPDAAHLVGGALDLELAATRLRGRDVDKLWRAVYACYEQDERYAPALSRLRQGLYFRPERAPLNPATVSRLYGRALRGSVSRLEKFRLCPFSYFAAYGLKLAPRRVYTLSAADRGDLCHFALAEVGRYISAHDISWREVDEELARLLVERALEAYLPRFMAGIMHSSARYAYLAGRIREALVAAVLLTAEHMKRGSFVPVAYELPFGGGGEGLPAFSVQLDDGRELLLSGQIDRVDMAESADGERAYFRVIDYKTGQVSLDREEIAAGLRLQLMVYLQVVLANSAAFTARQAKAAGMYYAEIKDAPALTASGEEEASLPGLRLSGLTAAEPEAVLLADNAINGWSELIPIAYNPARGEFYANASPLSAAELEELQRQLIAALKDSAAAMLEGMIQVSPLIDEKRDACAWCDFRAVCGFDRQLGLRRAAPGVLTGGEEEA